jgi:hypothetical protein
MRPYSAVAAEALLEIAKAAISGVLLLDEHFSRTLLYLKISLPVGVSLSYSVSRSPDMHCEMLH